MVKTTLIIAAGIIAALIIGNVIEISWHPEHLVQVPAALGGAFTQAASQVGQGQLFANLGARLSQFTANLRHTGLPATPSPQVAGAQDASTTPSANLVIPLKF